MSTCYFHSKYETQRESAASARKGVIYYYKLARRYGLTRTEAFLFAIEDALDFFIETHGGRSWRYTDKARERSNINRLRYISKKRTIKRRQHGSDS